METVGKGAKVFERVRATGAGRLPGRRMSVFCLGIFWGVAAILLAAKPDFAGVVFLNSTPTGVLTVPSQSFAELRFRDVVRQKYDFSCGSAAVATLLTYE